jgi:CubicO group peptidase (beta-lactamase class C family)
MKTATLLSACALLLVACGGGGGGDGSVSVSSFSATPEATNSGTPVALNWTVSKASKLMLQPDGVDVTGKTSYEVSPSETTTYTLVASDGDQTTQATTTVRVYDWSAVDAALDGYVSSGQISGYSFITFDKSSTLHTKAGGDISVDDVRPILSASKMPSAAAILTLVDSGKLALDTPVSSYLAGSPVNWPSDKSAITLRMLLDHTSGLPGNSDPSLPNCVSDEVAQGLEHCVQDIADTALISTPGEAFNYSPTGLHVAGYIATLVSGAASWQDFFSSVIGTPLGLTTYTYGDSALISNPRPEAGAVTNVADYAKILQLLQNGGIYNGTQILSQSMITEMTNNQVSDKSVVYTPAAPPTAPEGFSDGYGFGFFIVDPGQYSGSAGPILLDPGAMGTTPWLDLALGYGAVILINQDSLTGLEMFKSVEPLIATQVSG